MTRNPRIISLAALALGASTSRAAPTGDFLPLEVDNQWTYERLYECCPQYSGQKSIRTVRVMASVEGDFTQYTLRVKDSIYEVTHDGGPGTPYASVNTFEATLTLQPDSTFAYADTGFYPDPMLSRTFTRRYYEGSDIEALIKDTLSLDVVRVGGSGEGPTQARYTVARGVGPLEFHHVLYGEIVYHEDFRLLEFNRRDYRAVAIQKRTRDPKRIQLRRRWDGQYWLGDSDILGRLPRKEK